VAVLATDAHDDHVRVSPELTKATGAAAAASEDLVLWRQTHGSWGPDEHLIDGQRIHVAGVVVHVLHTPGHAPGAVCFDVEDIRTGDPGCPPESEAPRTYEVDVIAGEVIVHIETSRRSGGFS